MKHLDLFSGIGGFAYAADQVWSNVEHIFCDNDPFCQQVIAKHWPGSEIYGDIRQLITDTKGARLSKSREVRRQAQPRSTRRRGFANDHSGIDLLTGGFPCQSFSQAGLRRGTSDVRWLWPEMFKVIQLTQPEWVIAENVSGLLTWGKGLAFEQVCADLESEDYTVQPFIIPAAAVGAPHRRDRVWFVAHATGVDDRGNTREISRADELEEEKRQKKRPAELGGANNRNTTNPQRPRSQNRLSRSEQEAGPAERRDGVTQPNWGQDWLKVATELCGVYDGLPVKLDGLELTKAGHRKQQLKAYGNAIVPAVAVEIMKGMAL